MFVCFFRVLLLRRPGDFFLPPPCEDFLGLFLRLGGAHGENTLVLNVESMLLLHTFLGQSSVVHRFLT